MSEGWDRLYDAINRNLPEWARWEGYATYALAVYVVAGIFGTFALLVALSGFLKTTIFAGAIASLLFLVGNYYRRAAKIRVECNQCGRHARGKNECPHCGELTYMGGTA